MHATQNDAVSLCSRHQRVLAAANAPGAGDSEPDALEASRDASAYTVEETIEAAWLKGLVLLA